MMHTLDRYFTHSKGNEMTDEIAQGLLRTVIRNGRKAFEDQRGLSGYERTDVVRQPFP